jgi:hypothetical protein
MFMGIIMGEGSIEDVTLNPELGMQGLSRLQAPVGTIFFLYWTTKSRWPTTQEYTRLESATARHTGKCWQKTDITWDMHQTARCVFACAPRERQRK